MSITTLVKNIFGSRNQRLLKQYQKTVDAVNQHEKAIQALSDAELQAKTPYFKKLLAENTPIDDILPEAFAVVREASRRTLGLRHFDVQLIGGIVLHSGKIAEMGTGEGKTLVATLPAYLNALSGKGVHIVTVNDYLAKRDAEWMRPIYEFLGLTVGINLTMMDPISKRAAFAADITYGTNNEFGFDYLRDNMAFAMGDRVQRELHFAIVDEVDSILIDEARTPLIISGPSEDSSELYQKINVLIPHLQRQEKEGMPGDYVLDEKNRQAHLTEDGHLKIEELLISAGILAEGVSLYAPANIMLMHHVLAGLRAHTLYQRDVHYIVRDKDVIIVDEHTGRSLPGRRWSEGLHQAVEAKEGANIQNENQTLASITFQNYFRLYGKLAGMTGTADTEAYEFQQIYGLEVVVMPTNKPSRRTDEPDKVYITKKEKFAAVITDIHACVRRQQPVLVGTASIETSEFLSNLLTQEKIPHQVLNAKFHQKEAEIIAEAGRPGAVTIATNMAGRGTDIVLGGNPETEIAALESATAEDRQRIKAAWQQRHDLVLATGGLHVIGSERHESRRIDNQLRGRCGRQGDAGSSCFYLSLEDDLMRIFAADRVSSIMRRLGLPEGEAIQHAWVSRSIETAQRKVEGHNFDIRKELLEFDDVANAQRKVIYSQRSDIMASEDLSVTIDMLRDDVINNVVNVYIQPDSMEEQWDVNGLQSQLAQEFGLDLPIAEWLQADSTMGEEKLRARLQAEFTQYYRQREQKLGTQVIRQFERAVLLQSLDSHWKDHLAAMDYLRQGIYLRGYAQKNPKQEYKREAFQLFSDLLDALKQSVISVLMTAEVQAAEDVEALEAQRLQTIKQQTMHFQHAAPNSVDGNEVEEETETGEENDSKVIPFTRSVPKVGRNDLCSCGSGKKYKHCHGALN